MLMSQLLIQDPTNSVIKLMITNRMHSNTLLDTKMHLQVHIGHAIPPLFFFFFFYGNHVSYPFNSLYP